MNKLICSECGEDIPECSLCGVEFGIDDGIICMDSGETHLCEACLDGWLGEHHNWSPATAEDK